MNHLKLVVHNDLYKLTYDDVDGELILDNHLISLISEDHHDDSFTTFEKLNFPDSGPLQLSILELLGRLFPFMPGSIDGGYKYLPKQLMPDEYKDYLDEGIDRITFFGGSFNPWHDGHAECLRQCHDYEDFVLVVPDYSPWKENQKEGPIQEILDIADHLESRFPIYPGFWALKERNPTSSWITKIPTKNVNWLLGDDTFKSILKWIEIEKVVKALHTIYVVPRDFKKEDIEEISLKLAKINPELEIVYLKEHYYQNISSTELRKK
jgi:nicotinate-nucleotide adenylyltransferase